VVAGLVEQLPDGTVLDGELVVWQGSTSPAGARRDRSAAGGVHRGRVDAELQRGEVEPSVPVDDQLADYLRCSTDCDADLCVCVMVRIDRVGMASGRDRPYYSGKHKCHGLNVQVIADPAGRLILVSPVLPGARHDMGLPTNTGSSTPMGSAVKQDCQVNTGTSRYLSADSVAGSGKPAAPCVSAMPSGRSVVGRVGSRRPVAQLGLRSGPRAPTLIRHEGFQV
jgi:hypothetical protein